MENLKLKLIDEIMTEDKEIKYYQNQYYEIAVATVKQLEKMFLNK